MGYCWKHFDRPVLLAGPKLLHTEIAIQHRLELCGINSSQKLGNKQVVGHSWNCCCCCCSWGSMMQTSFLDVEGLTSETACTKMKRTQSRKQANATEFNVCTYLQATESEKVYQIWWNSHHVCKFLSAWLQCPIKLREFHHIESWLLCSLLLS